MNVEHLRLLSSQYWYETLRDSILPFTLGTADLGDDVLEMGPGPGLSTDLLRGRVGSLTALELDLQLADALSSRLAGTNVEVVHVDGPPLPFGDRRFTGAASFVLFHHVPTEEMQDRLFAEVARVLQPHSVFAAFDSMGSQELANFHGNDVYNTIDPDTLEPRLLRAGFAAVELQTLSYGWAVRAVTAG
ncbi:MAG TPA: class I SAM-dependent methyltransferase [Acidimicrobiales bacterium]|nr:class I SAM-dependent methyltransferase [Acidimicrobiales bacterium]